MAAKKKAAKAGAGAYAAGKAVRSNTYVQRLIEDEELRDEPAHRLRLREQAYARMSTARAPQGPDGGQEGAARAARGRHFSARGRRRAARHEEEEEPPWPAARRRPRRRRPGPRLSEGLRKKVLDALFGAEEEFEYTASTTPEPRPARANRWAARRASAVRDQAFEKGRLGRPFSFEPGPRGAPRLASQLDIARGMEAAVETPRAARGREGPAHHRGDARRAWAARGAAGSTFDHVAREAGVSRGLLHYYFGSKERLLVEVVRHDCEVRNRGMEERLAQAQHGRRDPGRARASASRSSSRTTPAARRSSTRC